MDSFDGAGPERRRPGWLVLIILLVITILVCGAVWLAASAGLNALPDLPVPGL
jgi:hypothetical protein